MARHADTARSDLYVRVTDRIILDLEAGVRPWLTILRNDKRFLFSASAHAQRATDFLHRLQPQAEPEARAA